MTDTSWCLILLNTVETWFDRTLICATITIYGIAIITIFNSWYKTITTQCHTWGVVGIIIEYKTRLTVTFAICSFKTILGVASGALHPALEVL